MGETASQNLYLSWEDSVAKAVKQYEDVLKRVPKSSTTVHPKTSYDSIIRMISVIHRRKKRMCKACKKKQAKAKKNNK